MKFLERLLKGETEQEREIPGRNEPCWCGSGKKYKKCHEPVDANKKKKADVCYGAT